MRIVIVILTSVMLIGCAAIFDGTSQEIMVNTNPPGATCEFSRNGTVISTIPATPAAATVQKRKFDITVTCKKDGYQAGTFINHSGVAGATVADVLGGVVTGGVAWAVDSASGADNKYDSPVNITLVPVQKTASSN
jgi:hypothetical protein